MKLADFAPDTGKGLTDVHYQIALNAIKSKELDKAEIFDLSKELADREEFDRTVGSAMFVLNRMHILIHGIAPHGETEKRAETMFAIPQKMVDFAERGGYDTFENIKRARVELKSRSVRVKEPQARQMMSDYYQANKTNLPKNLAQHRDEIIRNIMLGLTPEEAFARYI